LPEATLQVACVYGDLTERLCARAAAGRGRVDIVDVLPIQLENLRRKLPAGSTARLLAMNSADLRLPAASYDRALVFFLLHEQPRHVRERTLSEVARVVKPGGKIVVVDYARPRWWNPLRYLWVPVLALLEPFALDLWKNEIAAWLPDSCRPRLRRYSFFGGLYQQLVLAPMDSKIPAARPERGHEKCPSARDSLISINVGNRSLGRSSRSVRARPAMEKSQVAAESSQKSSSPPG
jgi:SAM-dependent methyltransferase